MAVEKGYERLWYRGLLLDLRFTPSFAYAGETVQLQEIVDNPKALPVPVLEAGFRTQKGLAFLQEDNTQTSDFIYRRDVFSLLGRERIIRTHTAECQKRGKYTFSQITLVSFAFFRSRKYVREHAGTQELYVYARRTDISGILPVLDRVLGEKEAVRRFYEDPFAFSGIREYTVYDPMKQINWKATAKTGSLMVNTYASVQSEQVMIFLDVSDPFIIRQEELVEESISLAATVFSVLSKRRILAGLCVNAKPEEGEDTFFRLSPARGENQLRTAERFLTSDFTGSRLVPFSEMVHVTMTDQTAGGRIVPLFISKNADRALQDALISSLKGGEKGIWVIPVRKGSEMPLERRERLRLVIRELP